MNRHEIKKKRLETSYRQVISEALLYKVDDERVNRETITITRVHINDNLTEAEVYFTSMSENNLNRLTKALYSARSFLLSILKSKIKIRYLPQIKFYYDNELKGADSLVDLIDKLSQEYQKK